MKKILLFLLLLFSLSSCNKRELTSNIIASSYIVIEQSTNKILQGNNYNETKSVASISKIMTAIVVIENSNINQTIIIGNEIDDVNGSSIYLKKGQQITIEDLLYGLLLRSGNDAAMSLANFVGKNVESFVNLMNQKAINLNMKDTHFNNPHGLDEIDGGNISSCYDMAILYSYCLKNETFALITSSKQHLNYVNKNKLVRTYKYCTGGKTGYTKRAKRTLVTSASKDDINLIVVTLNCSNDFLTHQNIYERYFDTHKSIKIINKGDNYLYDYYFNSNNNYYFITNEDDLTLYYVVNKKNSIIEVYLYNTENKIVDYIKVSVSHIN